MPDKKLDNEHSIILKLDNNQANRDLLSSNFSAATFQNKELIQNSQRETQKTLVIDSRMSEHHDGSQSPFKRIQTLKSPLRKSPIYVPDVKKNEDGIKLIHRLVNEKATTRSK